MSTVSVTLNPTVDIDPIPTGTGGIVRGATITVKGSASCSRETIDTGPLVPGDDAASGTGTENAPEAITGVTVVLGNNAFSVAAKPTGPNIPGTNQKMFTTWTTDPLTITGVVKDLLKITATVSAGGVFDTEILTMTVDRTPPILTLLSPSEIVKAVTGNSATIRIEGKASDAKSPVTAVEWRLAASASAQFNPASTSNGFADWTADVTVPTGTHTVFIWARDGEGNTSEQTSVVLHAVTSFTPKDPNDLYGPAAYLEDLLRFAATVLTDGANAPLTRDKIAAVYLQRFVELTDPLKRAGALQPVYQMRIGVEVLRDYLGTVPADIATRHRQRAYAAVLRHLGTSAGAISDTRGDEAAPEALAARLGLDAPARLDSLLLEGGQLTEDRLQEIFGLVSIAWDVMRQGLPPQPQLLDWRLGRVQARWREQDDAARVFGDIKLPVIDPDQLGEADFRTPQVGDPAYKLWTDRKSEITGDLDAIEAKPKTVAGFEGIVNTAIAPLADLRPILDDHKNGVDVGARLAGKRLTLPAFVRLMRCDQLVRAGTMTDSDWADVHAIASYVKKVRERYGTWRDQERDQGVTLSPASFVPSAGTLPPDALPRWRASARDRQAWGATLRARTGERQDLIEAYQAIVDAAELETLPVLRGELAAVAKTTPSSQLPLPDLRIDLDTAPARRTTRLHEALETLLEVLFGVRIGAFKQGAPQSWKFKSGYTEANFDEDWRWFGSPETWRGGIGAFYYPDSHLHPTRRPVAEQTAAFQELVRDLRALGRVTPAAVRAAGATYLGKVRGQIGGLPADFVLTDQLSDKNLTDRQTLCKDLFGKLTNPYLASKELKEVFYFAPLLCALTLQRAGEFVVALDWFQTVYAYHLPPDKQKIYHGLVLERQGIQTDFARHPSWPRAGLDPFAIVPNRQFALARFTQISLARCLVDFADAEYAGDTDESVARARGLYQVAAEVLTQIETATTATVTLPEDPVITALRAHVTSNLTKVRNGLTNAGLERPSPVEGGASIAPRQPTPYRFAVLIARAKELAQLAGQTEAAMLAALERRDAEALNLLQADQGLELARENVRLRDLGVTVAEDGVALASLQQDRAQISEDHFQELLAKPISFLEGASLVVGVLGSLAAAALAPVPAAASAGRAGLGGAGRAFLGEAGSVLGQFASFERRAEEWQLQLALAQQDVAIGAQQVTLARDQVAVAVQEQLIAALQAGHARATVNFLAGKFTGLELYEFMSEVLMAVYRSLLQQATTVAKLAQAQLAFERQEPVRSLIQSDYWEVPIDGAARPDRKGLTGSTRLLADIVELDQHAFLTDRRKLQLTRTLSLARLAPVEFERFRQSGVMIFPTPQEMFDRDFPGHYLRLIKRVRTSVVALVPPTEGIRATLSTPGFSRVVVGGGVGGQAFRSVVVRRDPETVALSSLRDATGLFDLGVDSQPELLLPFEGGGVDTVWRLELPKVANPFDFKSIADVLFTLEYTALHSSDYRQQVIRALDPVLSADRPFSLRQEFPDLWYELHNHDQSSTPMTVRFTTSRADFPPNLDGLDIEHLVLYFARADGSSFEVSNAQLRFTPSGSQQPRGGVAGVAVDGVISTRRTNGETWHDITEGELAPYGTWELKLPTEMSDRFAAEEIDDILLDIAYSGRTPDWPT